MDDDFLSSVESQQWRESGDHMAEHDNWIPPR